VLKWYAVLTDIVRVTDRQTNWWTDSVTTAYRYIRSLTSCCLVKQTCVGNCPSPLKQLRLSPKNHHCRHLPSYLTVQSVTETVTLTLNVNLISLNPDPNQRAAVSDGCFRGGGWSVRGNKCRGDKWTVTKANNADSTEQDNDTSTGIRALLVAETIHLSSFVFCFISSTCEVVPGTISFLLFACG